MKGASGLRTPAVASGQQLVVSDGPCVISQAWACQATGKLPALPAGVLHAAGALKVVVRGPRLTRCMFVRTAISLVVASSRLLLDGYREDLERTRGLSIHYISMDKIPEPWMWRNVQKDE